MAVSTTACAVLVGLLGVGLSGCSAIIGATATDPERYVRPGMTKSDLTHRLGAPLRVQPLDPPVPTPDIPAARLALAVQPDSNGSDAAAPGPAVEKSYFRFRGRLKCWTARDAADVAAVEIRTLGLVEIVATPLAIVDAVSSHDHVLVAWFDDSGNALAYTWTSTKDLPHGLRSSRSP